MVRKLHSTMYKGNNYYERVEILTLCFVYSILLTTSQSIISPEKIKTSSITLFQFSFTEMLGTNSVLGLVWLRLVCQKAAESQI